MNLFFYHIDKIIESTASSVSKHIETLSRKEVSNDLLCSLTIFLDIIITTFPSLLGKEPKKNHLIQLLHPIRYQWNIIGEQLNVDFGDIMSAQYNVQNTDAIKLSEVLQIWRDKRTCKVSWEEIISVVDDPPVKNKRLADEICEFLARPEIMNEYLHSDQPGKIRMNIFDKIIVVEDPYLVHRLYY